MTRPPRTYPAIVTKVIDGDTARFTADLGFGIYFSVVGRLAGINARELSEPGGKEAREHLTGLIPIGTQVLLTSVAWDKYGRADCLIHLSDGKEVGQQMMDDGWAVTWDGRGPRPTPPWPVP